MADSGTASNKLDTGRDSELILNDDGSVYHLALKPGQVASTIITVGDPARVELISQHFDIRTHCVQKREFVTHTGRIGNKELTVISTGIGTGNIDIVINELDALFNVSLLTGYPLDKHTSLEFIRVGTSGSMSRDVEVNQLLASSHGMGLDGLAYFYGYESQQSDIHQAFSAYVKDKKYQLPVEPYFAQADSRLLARFADGLKQGITVTSPGFYAPQGRSLRKPLSHEHLIKELAGFRYGENMVTNFEMETSALFMLANQLGHRAVSLNAILANRATGEFSKDPKKVIRRLITRTINRL